MTFNPVIKGPLFQNSNPFVGEIITLGSMIYGGVQQKKQNMAATEQQVALQRIEQQRIKQASILSQQILKYGVLSLVLIILIVFIFKS